MRTLSVRLCLGINSLWRTREDSSTAQKAWKLHWTHGMWMHVTCSNDAESCMCQNFWALPHHGTENPIYPCEQPCGNVVTSWETICTLLSLCPHCFPYVPLAITGIRRLTAWCAACQLKGHTYGSPHRPYLALIDSYGEALRQTQACGLAYNLGHLECNASHPRDGHLGP